MRTSRLLSCAFLLSSVISLAVHADVIPPSKITVVVGGEEETPPEGPPSSTPAVAFGVRRAEPQPPSSALVRPLVEGAMYPTEKGYVMIASITLVADSGYFMVVDTPSSTDALAKEQMLKALNELGVLPSQIHFAVTTHGHPDHFGQANFFSNARQFFGPYEYSGSTFERNDLFNKDVMRLTENIELWNTAGHTSQCISVIVHQVAGIGTVGIVGDLFYSEIDALSEGAEWSRDAWNPRLGLENRKRVLCAVDAIVPGHAKMFLVTPEMRLRAGCSMLPTIAANNQIAAFRSDPQPPKPPAATPPPPEVVQPTLVSLPQSFDFNPPAQAKAYGVETLTNPTIPPPPVNPEAVQLPSVQPAPVPLAPNPYAVQQQPTASDKSLQQVLYPMIESAANQIAHYLSAGQGPVPMPYLQAAEVRTSYPANYPLPMQLQVLPQQRKQMRKE